MSEKIRKDVVVAEIAMTKKEWEDLVKLLPENSLYKKIFEKVIKQSKGGYNKTKQKNIQTASSGLLELANKYRKTLVKNITPQEAVFRSFLDDFGIKYKFQKIEFYGNKFYIVDFYLPEYNCVVEIDGNHHYTSEYIVSDAERTQHLKMLKIGEVYRIKNSDCIRGKLVKWWEELDLVKL